MKKAVAFLLAFLIFVAPMTTLVKADVVIGDNDDIIINENALVLGRKLALMESLSDLALSGVTEFTINNADDVDDYLDSLWGELNNAITSLQDGTGFLQISADLRSRYYDNLTKYRDYITNRGDYLSYSIQNPTTTLLKTWFANNIYGKQTTEHTNLTNGMCRALSEYNNRVIPILPDNQQYLLELRLMNEDIDGFGFFWRNYALSYDAYWVRNLNLDDIKTHSYFGSDLYGNIKAIQNLNEVAYATAYRTQVFATPNILTLNITTNSLGTVIGTINNISIIRNVYYEYLQSNPSNINYDDAFYIMSSSPYWNGFFQGNSLTFNSVYSYTGDSIQDVLHYFALRFHNINVYVDDELWAYVGPSDNTSLDIDGYLTIYGNDTPIDYYIPKDTQIDYDQLYQVIYNAIRDNLPISKDDITYYDSHDNIYSPTIINNYGDEEGEESDLIDTILDYAVIPKFDTAIAQPMRNALTNGVVIMNNSITNVIPQEILLILGACFFLLLFAVVINRMIK